MPRNSSSSLQSKLMEAIDKKMVLRIVSRTAGDKQQAHARTIEPHLIGVHKTTGSTLLVAYQTGGGSVAGEPPQWRMYDLANIDSVSPAGGSFSRSRPGYNPVDSRMKQVLAAVDKSETK